MTDFRRRCRRRCRRLPLDIDEIACAIYCAFSGYTPNDWKWKHDDEKRRWIDAAEAAINCLARSAS